MVTEVVETETASICPKHGVERFKKKRGIVRGGWRWECKECRKEYNAKYRQTRPEEVAKRERESNSRRAKKEFVVGPYTVKGWKVWHWRRTYGLEPEDVLGLYRAQEGRCMFGGEPLAWENIHVDHEHGYPGCRETSKGTYGCPKEAVRGLACWEHNIAEGRLEQLGADPMTYVALAKWHVERNGGKWTELCGCQEVVSA